jgi:hypothetical protein
MNVPISARKSDAFLLQQLENSLKNRALQIENMKSAAFEVKISPGEELSKKCTSTKIIVLHKQYDS